MDLIGKTENLICNTLYNILLQKVLVLLEQLTRCHCQNKLL